MVCICDYFKIMKVSFNAYSRAISLKFSTVREIKVRKEIKLKVSPPAKIFPLAEHVRII